MDYDKEKTRTGFEGICGQEVPVRVLSHLIAKDRLPGTLLFTGPGGIGKLTTALSLAKKLHCREGGSADCECRDCSAIRTGRHPDVIVLSRTRQVGVDEMREIVALAGLRSAPGQERVVILDRAENITTAAANAALKTLEEPGEHVRFILVTDVPASLLSTVRSRAYRLRFTLLSTDAMMEFVKEAGDDPSDVDVMDAVRLAGGRPGRYLRMKHVEGYAEAIKAVSIWMGNIVKQPQDATVGMALKWKSEFWEFSDMLMSAERDLKLPRGGNAVELGRCYRSEGSYQVNPLNWRTGEEAGKEGRWGKGRRALLLAELLRRVVSQDLNARSVGIISRLNDFMEKVRFNCSFDIALERLYFDLAGTR